MADRVPPHNSEAEKSVLGAILIDNDSLNRIADDLIPESFYVPQHGIIFESMLELYSSGQPIDVVTLNSLLKKKKKLAQVGGGAYLSELIAGVPTSAHIKEYSRLVKESSVRRNLIALAAEVDESSRVEDRNLDEVLDNIEAKLFSLSQDNTQRDFKQTAELLEEYMEKIDQQSKNPDGMMGIPTGIRSLDGLLGGLHKSDLIILASRPSVGKSSFAATIARNIAVDQKATVAIFSLEMPDIQIVERLLAQQIGIDLFILRMGKFTDQQYTKYAQGAGALSEAKIFVDDTPALNIMQLRSKARKLKMDVGLDLIIVDYLQLMQGRGNKSDNRTQEITEISRAMKILARELDIPVIALSQLNRAVESRGDHRPQLSDLRESGSIEQDADIVIFLNREKLYNPETERPDSADVIVAKHRGGPTGMVELKFEEKITRFVDA